MGTAGSEGVVSPTSSNRPHSAVSGPRRSFDLNRENETDGVQCILSAGKREK